MEEASQLTLKASARIVGSDENPISTETLRGARSGSILPSAMRKAAYYCRAGP